MKSLALLLLLAVTPSAHAELGSYWLSTQANNLRITEFKIEQSLQGSRALTDSEMSECLSRSNSDELQSCSGKTVAIYTKMPVVTVSYDSGEPADREVCPSSDCPSVASIALHSLTQKELGALAAAKTRKARVQLADQLFSVRIAAKPVTLSRDESVGCDYTTEGDQVRCGSTRTVIETKQQTFFVVNRH